MIALCCTLPPLSTDRKTSRAALLFLLCSCFCGSHCVCVHLCEALLPKRHDQDVVPTGTGGPNHKLNFEPCGGAGSDLFALVAPVYRGWSWRVVLSFVLPFHRMVEP